MKARTIALAVIALAAVSIVFSGCGAQPVVKKIDHVAIQCSDAQGLFEFLTGTLGLPVAWPFSSYPQFETGGVQVGNVNIETLHYGGMDDSVTMFYGIVLEPYPLDEVTEELKARGAEPSDPEVQQKEVDGKEVTLWTNVYLNALCSQDYVVYLCEYSEAAESELTSRDVSGPLGPMGIESVREVGITSGDAESLKEKWAEVFDPCSFSSEGLMEIGTGPSIRITDGEGDTIQALVLEVTSLDSAREFLEKNSLLGTSSADELRIDPVKVQGLDIMIVEK